MQTASYFPVAFRRAALSFVAAALALLAIAPDASALNPGPTPFMAATGWPGTHSDSRNSDFVPFVTSALETDWTALDGAATLFAPTIGPEGNLYVATSQGLGYSHLHAFDRDGNLLWESPPMASDADVDSYAGSNAPIVDVDGDVYCSDGDQLWAFHSGGSLKWVSALPEADAPFISPVITNDGYVGGVTIRGKVVFFDRTTGVQIAPAVDLPGVSDLTFGAAPDGLWDPAFFEQSLIDATYAGFFGAGYEIVNTPAIDPYTGRMFITGSSEFGTSIGYLYGIDVAAGNASVAFATRMGGGSGTSPAVSPDGKQVYAVSSAGLMVAVDTTTGEVLWETAGAADSASPTVGPDGTVYTGAGTQKLTALDPRDGSIRWQTDRGDLARAELPTVAAQPPLLPDGAPVAGINSVVTVTGNELLAVMTFHYVFDNPNPGGRPLLPVYHHIMLGAFSTSDGTLKRLVDLRDANEGIVSVGADGAVYVSHGAIFSTLFWNSLNGFLSDPQVRQPFAPLGGITALRPVSPLEQALQGVMWVHDLARQAREQNDDAKKGSLDTARTAAERGVAQLSASSASMLDAAAQAEIAAPEATSRAASISSASGHLTAALAAITATDRTTTSSELTAATADLAAAVEGLACDDAYACTTAQATFIGGVCTTGEAATAPATKLTAKLQPETAKDKVVLKATLSASALTTDPAATGVTVRLGRSAPYDDAHQIFEGTVQGIDLVDIKSDGSVLAYKAAKGAVGISMLRVQHDKDGNVVVKATVKGAQTEGLRGARAMSLAVVFGDDPSTDDCAGDAAVACTTAGKSVKCKK
ncbi:MAG: PQQ-binding-like beta-propeller repeat protein [Deltaproteobacteria bacterium]|nr:PQQ-binding-like beta-propeller repeat protein [Deltaproteobacteria bacterium]